MPAKRPPPAYLGTGDGPTHSQRNLGLLLVTSSSHVCLAAEQDLWRAGRNRPAGGITGHRAQKWFGAKALMTQTLMGVSPP